MKRNIQIQRLVDHELDAVNRRQLVEQLTPNDPAWRTIALAFIEKQLLDETITDFAHSESIGCDTHELRHSNFANGNGTIDPGWMANANPDATHQADLNGRSERPLEKADRVAHSSATRRFDGRRFLQAAWMLAIAIGFILVGFSIGQLDGISPFGAKLDRQQPATQISQETGATATNNSDLTDALARCSTPIPDQFRRDLLSAGYILNEDEELKQVQLPFGGTVEMPVRKFDIRYLGPSAFQ